MKTPELFPAESVAMDSPRIAWMKKHGILTWHDSGKRDGFQVCPAGWFAGFRQWWPEKTGIEFFAIETAHNGGSRIGEGDTEADALADLLTCGEARANGIKLWNEEP
jgi:hypothetical protein